MSRTVHCVLLGREAEGLDRPPYPGELGQRIYENVSKQAWADWLQAHWTIQLALDPHLPPAVRRADALALDLLDLLPVEGRASPAAVAFAATLADPVAIFGAAYLTIGAHRRGGRVIDKALRAAGRPVMFLSNAPRRAAAVAERLQGLGVPPEVYDGILSSGESVHRGLAGEGDPDIAALGSRCTVIGPPADRSLLDGVERVSVVADPAEADFILNIGPPPTPEETLDSYRALLDDGLARGLPMVCANPDRTVVIRGEAVICAGALAEYYETHGGRVLWRGKPDPAVFAECAALMGVAPEEALMIGDSLVTDIKGAAAAGMDSVLVATGILADRIGGAEGLDMAAVMAVAEEAGVAPTYVLPRVVW